MDAFAVGVRHFLFYEEEKMMEIYGTIHFRLILPHIPGFQQEPLPEIPGGWDY